MITGNASNNDQLFEGFGLFSVEGRGREIIGQSLGRVRGIIL